MPTPSVIKQYQYSDAINRRVWDSKYLSDQFQVNPVTAAVGGGAATGAAGDNNVLYTRNGAYEWNVIGTQTILAPKLIQYGATGANDPTLSGLNLVQDATAGDGIELSFGSKVTNPATSAIQNPNPFSFVIGSDAAFFMTAEFTTRDASGTNPLIIGWRKAQAFDATLANYTDFVSIGIVGTANPNTIKIQTQIGTAGVVTTDTTQTWADLAIHRISILVSATGVVTYQIDSLPPTVTAAYTFTSGICVTPFIRFVNAADVTESCVIDDLQIGFQS
jgi:hypothetical protein